MVAKSGFRFQFPIKHVSQPSETPHRTFEPKHGPPYGPRAGAAEGFGGNRDLAHHANIGEAVSDSRDATLNHEYSGENHHRRGADINPHRTVKFAAATSRARCR